MGQNCGFRTVWISIDYSCNNRCKWCYAKGQITSDSKDMQLNLAKESINLINEIGARGITLIGGEPTLYPHLIDVLKYSKKKGMKIGMVSNGRKLADKAFLDSLFDAGLCNLTISINGSNAKIHDAITQIKGSFEETKKALQNCVELGCPLSTETTVCKENKRDVKKILTMLYNLGVKRPQFNICTQAITGINNSTLPIAEDARIREELYLYAKSLGKEIRFIVPLPFCSYSPELRDELLESKTIYNRCFLCGGNGFVIDYNGDVLPCVRWSGYPLGNIKKDDGKFMNKEEFLDFWTNGLPQKFREKLWRYPSKKCIKDKKNWGKCMGGCPMIWLKYDARKEIPGV